ncbi:MAG: hypothetical protein WCJ30_06435 [Deltaproteobacteria bacterium]
MTTTDIIAIAGLSMTFLTAVLGGFMRLTLAAAERRIAAIEVDSERCRGHREATAVLLAQAVRDVERLGREPGALEARIRAVEQAQTEHSGEAAAMRGLMARLEDRFVAFDRKLDRLLGLDGSHLHRREGDRGG